MPRDNPVAAALNRIAAALETSCRLERIELTLSRLENLVMAGTEATQETLARVAALEQNQAETSALVESVATDISGVRTELAAVRELLALEQADNANIAEANQRLAVLEQKTQLDEDRLRSLLPTPPVDPVE